MSRSPFPVALNMVSRSIINLSCHQYPHRFGGSLVFRHALRAGLIPITPENASDLERSLLSDCNFHHKPFSFSMLFVHFGMLINSEIEQQKFIENSGDLLKGVEKVGERAKKDFEAREWNEFQIFTNLLHRIVQEQFCPSNAEFLSFFVFARTIDSIELELQTFRSEQMNLSHESLEPAAQLTLPRNSYYMPLPSTLNRLHNIKTQESHFRIPFVPRIATSESVFNSFRHLFILQKKPNHDPNSVTNHWSNLTDPQFFPISSDIFDAQTFEQDDETLEKSLQNCLRIVTDNPRSPQVQLSNEFVLNLLQFLSSPNDQLRTLSHQITVILAKSQAFRSILLAVGPDGLKSALREGTVEQVHAYLIMCEEIFSADVPLSSDPESFKQLHQIGFDFNDFCDVKVDSVDVFKFSLLLVSRFMIHDLCSNNHEVLDARLRRFVSSRHLIERFDSNTLDSSEIWMILDSPGTVTPCLGIFFLLQLPIPDVLNFTILNSHSSLTIGHLAVVLHFASHITTFPPNFMVDVIAERIWRDEQPLYFKATCLLDISQRLPSQIGLIFFQPFLFRGLDMLIFTPPNTIDPHLQADLSSFDPISGIEFANQFLFHSGNIVQDMTALAIQTYPPRFRVKFYSILAKTMTSAPKVRTIFMNIIKIVVWVTPFELATRIRSIILDLTSIRVECAKDASIYKCTILLISNFIHHFSPLIPQHFDPFAIFTPLLQNQPSQLLLQAIPLAIHLVNKSRRIDPSPATGGDLAMMFSSPHELSWIQSWLSSITFQVNPNHNKYVNVLVKDVLKCLFNENEGIGSKALLGVYDLVRRSSAEGMLRLIELGLVGCVISAVDRSESLEDYEIGCWILSRVFQPHLLSVFATRYYRPVSSWYSGKCKTARTR
ncbi:hypothetical protein BLNAU_14810 [Blattamonas nauphoetae]|uniref:Uncharacterized protein n=1 Tax=Blattamonas nauphoetae TaxID=2049346 RepID=A0ABQ9XCI9_9EUKA|nr:hypothetical protein BLNAU_14810 [Blattamonas nauphoetae]